MDQSQLEKFFNSAVQFLPFLEKEDLVPDTAGIRPKLQGENEGFRDFVIKHRFSQNAKPTQSYFKLLNPAKKYFTKINIFSPEIQNHNS